MLLITRMSQYNCLLAASFQLNVYPSVTHTFFLDTKIKNVYMQYYRSFDDTMALTKQYLLLCVRCLNGAYPFGTCVPVLIKMHVSVEILHTFAYTWKER